MNIREAITEKKTIYRITTALGEGVTFVLASEMRLKDGFLNILTDDFTYTLNKYKDENDAGKIKTSVLGDMVKYNKHVNATMVLTYEEILPEDSRYATYAEIVERCSAEKCNIAVPPEKKIIIAN